MDSESLITLMSVPESLSEAITNGWRHHRRQREWPENLRSVAALRNEAFES
jgi:hypothetical protein